MRRGCDGGENNKSNCQNTRARTGRGHTAVPRNADQSHRRLPTKTQTAFSPSKECPSSHETDGADTSLQGSWHLLPASRCISSSQTQRGAQKYVGAKMFLQLSMTKLAGPPCKRHGSDIVCYVLAADSSTLSMSTLGLLYRW
jgi:hypothetical protein